jgi:cell division protein FtsW (lipid II flippase)
MKISRAREVWLLLLAFAVLGLSYVVVWQTYRDERLRPQTPRSRYAAQRATADTLLAKVLRPTSKRSEWVKVEDDTGTHALYDYRSGRALAWREDAPVDMAHRDALAKRYLAAADLPPWEAFYAGQEWRLFLPPAVMLLAWLLVSWALHVRRCRETLLTPIAALLTGVGALMLLRLAAGAAVEGAAKGLVLTGPYFFSQYEKQFGYFLLAVGLLLGMVLFLRDYRVLARFRYMVAALAVALLLITTVFGSATEGQTLSLKLGPILFQPHDPVKLLLVIFMAAYLVEHRELIAFARGKFGLLTAMDLRYMGPLVAVWALVMAIVFVHDDLGAALLIFGAFLGMLYLGTGRFNYVAFGLLLSLAGVVVGYQVAKAAHLGFVKRVDTRIAIWQNPWRADLVNDKGYQITQALMAIGNGRLVGAGLGAGYPEEIPAIQTDMVHAAISEDLGLLGGGAIIMLFLILIGRMFVIGVRSSDRFGQLLAAGLGVTFAVQTWVILAGTLKVIPLTGITLPLVSYGGTSLIVNFLLLGLALKVAEVPQSEAREARETT